jgi:ribonuclease HII
VPDFSLESGSAWPVCGVDEAGRGPLAGPVVAAAVILRPDRIPDGLDDSKVVPRERRIALDAVLRRDAEVAVGIASVDEIDILNVLRASLLAMARAVAGLPRPPASALVDGGFAPALACPVRGVVKGDGASLSIAAASIVAKCARDRIMAGLAQEFPGYGWETNAGYGTPAHLDALCRLGPTPHHRRGFAPVRAASGLAAGAARPK